MSSKAVFDKMLDIGKVGEELVANIIQSEGAKVVSVADRCFEHDLEIITFGEYIPIEVKTVSKYYPRETRYLFLETCQNIRIRSLGWLFTTDARFIYWVFPNNDNTYDIYVYKTSVLRSYIGKGKLKIYNNSCGADTEGFMLSTNDVPCERIYKNYCIYK